MNNAAVFIRLRRALICGAIAVAWFGGISSPTDTKDAQEAHAVQAEQISGTTHIF